MPMAKTMFKSSTSLRSLQPVNIRKNPQTAIHTRNRLDFWHVIVSHQKEETPSENGCEPKQPVHKPVGAGSSPTTVRV